MLGARVVAVMRKHPDFVSQRAAGEAAVQHRAAVAACRKPGGHDRSINEIEVGGAGCLLEAEWNLELTCLKLQAARRAIVDVYVTPRDRVLELTLDLKLHRAADLAGDADAATADVEGITVEALDGGAGCPAVALQTRSEFHPQSA